MADNSTLPATGDVIRDKDRAGVKTQIVALDLNPAGTESLMAGVLPVSDNGGSLTVDGTVGVSGTVSVTGDGGTFPVTDSGGSLTVDAPVGTPVYVRLSDGTSALATLPVAPAAAGHDAQVQGSRPANTTAYAAGSVIGDAGGSAIFAFANVGKAGGLVYVAGADFRYDAAAVPSGMTGFRLHLYDASPTARADGAAWTLPAGDRTSYLGYVDLPAVSAFGATLWSQVDAANRLIKLGAATTAVYGVFQTIGGFTPASGTTFKIGLRTVEV